MRTHNTFLNALYKTQSLIHAALITAIAICGSTFAQEYSPDSAEVLRRGNSVEHIAGSQADSETVSLAALAPPADDSHKWFITLVKQEKCKPCDRLLADFSTDANLRAFADTTDAKNSWSHFNIYSIDDETQAWRFKNIVIKGYPTLIVQPPRNGRYGDPAKVVLQKTGYDGNAKKLAEQMRVAIRAEAAKSEGKKGGGDDGKKNVTTISVSRDALRSKKETEQSGQPTLLTAPLRVAANHVASNPPPFTPPKNEPILPIAPNNNAPLLPPTVPPSIDPDAKPEIAPQPQVDPNNPVAPNIDPTKIIAPATPDPSKIVAPVTPSLYPQHPEAVVIVDKFADSVAKDASWAKIRSAVQRMQRDRPGLIVRVLDRRDAANYPVQPNELPAIITTSEGRIETKLDKTLLETVTNDAPAFPWQALLSLFTGGFSWVGVGALGIWAIAMIRRWRIAQGKKILVDNESAGRIRELLEKLFERIGEKK